MMTVLFSVCLRVQKVTWTGCIRVSRYTASLYAPVVHLKEVTP